MHSEHLVQQVSQDVLTIQNPYFDFWDKLVILSILFTSAAGQAAWDDVTIAFVNKQR